MQAVTVVIPTFNAKHLLMRYCPSVINALSPGDALYIVDDASTDGTAAWAHDTLAPLVAEKGCTFLCITNSKNLRFAASVNKGVAAAQTPLIFLCNNDVELYPDTLTTLRKVLDDDSVFAASCLEYEQSEAGEWSGKNLLWFARGLFQHSKALTKESGATAWASGGSALFSREKWQQLGGFDPKFYPAYWEDIDLSFRARKRGWKVLFESKAVVLHKHESTHSVVFGTRGIAEMSWKNAFYFTWKNGTLIQKFLFLVWQPYWWIKRSQHA